MKTTTYGPTSGRPLLLLHGGGVAGWMWDPMRAELRADRRVLVPDLPGHDRSADQRYVSHDDTIERLTAVLEAEDAPATVVGFSLGAQLAVLLAARRPDLVSDVVVISAQAIPLRAPRALLSLVDATAGLARNPRFARLQARSLFVPDELMEDYLRTSAGMAAETIRSVIAENVGFTPPESWRTFAGRSLVLVGSREKSLMRRSAMLLHSQAPHSDLEMVDGCGHGIPLQQPGWLARRVEEWADPTPPGTPTPS